jgi:hypothetical protein
VRKQSALGIGDVAFRGADTPAAVEDFDLQFESNPRRLSIYGHVGHNPNNLKAEDFRLVCALRLFPQG